MRNVTRNEMIDMFGEEKYLEANEAFAGRNHYFAKNMKTMTDEERNKLIVELAYALVPLDDIAERFELSKSRIYSILNSEQ